MTETKTPPAAGSFAAMYQATARPAAGGFAASYERMRDSSLGAEPRQLRLEAIEPEADQPRRSFDATALEELAASIRIHGVVQPLVVRPDPKGRPGLYRLVAGERRWRAAKLAGLESVPVVIKSAEAKVAAELALIENLQRQDLPPLEEAAAMKALLEAHGLSHRELAERLGKTKAYVEQRVRLLHAPSEVQAALQHQADRFSPGHAKAVVQVAEASWRTELVRRVLEEGLSVREAERRAQALKGLAGAAPAQRAKLASQALAGRWQGLSPQPKASATEEAPALPLALAGLATWRLFQALQAQGEEQVGPAALREALKADLKGL